MNVDIAQVADEVERATAPDRRLDCLTWLIVGEQVGRAFELNGDHPIRPGEIVQGRWFGSAFEKYPEDVEGVARNWRVPRFTASTDAAATILIDVGHVLWSPIGKKPSVATETDAGWSDYSSGFCRAAAMTAAGLRAWNYRPAWSHARMLEWSNAG